MSTYWSHRFCRSVDVSNIWSHLSKINCLYHVRPVIQWSFTEMGKLCTKCTCRRWSSSAQKHLAVNVEKKPPARGRWFTCVKWSTTVILALCGRQAGAVEMYTTSMLTLDKGLLAVCRVRWVACAPGGCWMGCLPPRRSAPPDSTRCIRASRRRRLACACVELSDNLG